MKQKKIKCKSRQNFSIAHIAGDNSKLNGLESKGESENYGKTSLLSALRKLDGKLLGFLKNNSDKLRPCEISHLEDEEQLQQQSNMRPIDLASRKIKRSASKSVSEVSTRSVRKKKRQSSIGSYIQLDVTRQNMDMNSSPYYANQRYNSKYVYSGQDDSAATIHKRFQCAKPRLGQPKRSLQETSTNHLSLSRMGADESSFLPPGIPQIPLKNMLATQRPVTTKANGNRSFVAGLNRRDVIREESRSKLGNSSDSLQLPAQDQSMLSRSKSFKQIHNYPPQRMAEEVGPLHTIHSNIPASGTNQKLMRRPMTNLRSRINCHDNPHFSQKENIDILNVEPSRVAFKDQQSTKEPLSELSQYSNKPKPILKQPSDRKLTYLKQEM